LATAFDFWRFRLATWLNANVNLQLMLKWRAGPLTQSNASSLPVPWSPSTALTDTALHGLRLSYLVAVERDDSEAKIWLDPIRLERSGGFSAKELRRIEQSVTDHHEQLMDSWNDFFNG